MSTLVKKKVGSINYNIERYESAIEVVTNCKKRTRTNDSFHDMPNESMGSWYGVDSYEQALDFMKNGYQPTVDSLRNVFKANKNGESTRFAFMNEVQGLAPVVPLALKGVPNCMLNMHMKPIKAKVVDIYYDMVASSGTDSKDIIKAGQTLLGTVVEMERQGYRFNLYAVQTYSNNSSCDMLVVKVKDARQPLDLKRISFPLTHTGFFRVIGFDWYSKVPDGKYRSCYGCALSYTLEGRFKKTMKELFGKNTISFSAVDIMRGGKDYVRTEVETNDSKN